MIKRYLLLMLLIPTIVFSQLGNTADKKMADDGIRFEKKLTWDQILLKAKAKNKYIFIDFYTTWCAPCKMMEQQVYPLEKVGNFYNEHFIAVSVQMDKTSRDNETIKAWYTDANKMEKQYSVNVYPTFLFLSPEGKPVHRAAGAFDKDTFLKMGANALDSQKQSYTLSAKYVPEKMETAELKTVAQELKYDNPELGAKLAGEYFKRMGVNNITSKEELDMLLQFKNDSVILKYSADYIGGLSDNKLYNKNNINFIKNFVAKFGTKGKAFQLFYRQPLLIDSVMHANGQKDFFAKKWVDAVISTEEVTPLVNAAKSNRADPDWNKISNTIKKKYGAEYSDRIIVKAKMSWFRNQKDSAGYTRYIVQYMEKYGKKMETDWGWNNNAWEIFTSSNNTTELNKALSWSRDAVLANPNANWMDTYANILYKLSRKDEAIMWEKTAVQLEPNNKEFADVLQKMKAGINN